MSDKAPSAPSALPLTPPLGSLCSVRWLTASIRISIGHDLVEPLKRLLYQDPVSKHFLASAIVSGFVVCMWDGSPGGGCLWMAFPLVSVLLFVPVFPLDRSNSGLKFWEMGGWPHPSTGGGGACLTSGYGFNLQVLPLLSRVFQLKSFSWGSGRLLLSWHLELSSC